MTFKEQNFIFTIVISLKNMNLITVGKSYSV
jgi:hypothetical protein